MNEARNERGASASVVEAPAMDFGPRRKENAGSDVVNTKPSREQIVARGERNTAAATKKRAVVRRWCVQFVESRVAISFMGC